MSTRIAKLHILHRVDIMSRNFIRKSMDFYRFEMNYIPFPAASLQELIRVLKPRYVQVQSDLSSSQMSFCLE